MLADNISSVASSLHLFFSPDDFEGKKRVTDGLRHIASMNAGNTTKQKLINSYAIPMLVRLTLSRHGFDTPIIDYSDDIVSFVLTNIRIEDDGSIDPIFVTDPTDFPYEPDDESAMLAHAVMLFKQSR